MTCGCRGIWSIWSWSIPTSSRPPRRTTIRRSPARSCGPGRASTSPSTASRRSSPAAPRWSCRTGMTRQPRLRHLLDGAADPAGGRPPAGGDLGDRAGRRRGHAADGLRLRLRLERRRLHAVAAAVHLLPGRRVRRVLPVVPRDRRRGQRQRLEARQEAVPDRRLRRVRRHHGACEEDRLRRAGSRPARSSSSPTARSGSRSPASSPRWSRRSST